MAIVAAEHGGMVPRARALTGRHRNKAKALSWKEVDKVSSKKGMFRQQIRPRRLPPNFSGPGAPWTDLRRTYYDLPSEPECAEMAIRSEER